MLRDPHALDVFHGEIGTASIVGSRIEYLGHARMVHQSQGLPLGLEPSQHLFGIHAGFDDLERDPASNGLFLLGQPDLPHPAFADFL